MAEYIRSDHRVFLRRCSSIMHSTQATLAHIPISDSSHIPVSEIRYQCTDCSRESATVQQFNLHRFRKHGWLFPAHTLIANTYCPICLAQFHIRTGASEHIMCKGMKHKCCQRLFNDGCNFSYLAANSLNEVEAARNVQLARGGHKRSYASQPAHRIAGHSRMRHL